MQSPYADEQSELFNRLLSQLESSWQGLPDKPEESPESNLCALWFAAAGKPKAVEYCARSDLPALTGVGAARLVELVEKNLSGVPLSYLTGRQCFMGLEMLAGPEALIPRKETEILGYATLDILNALVEERGEARVIDMCTGAGNLALALAHYQPQSQVFGSDICPQAISLAERNARHLSLSERVYFRQGDMFTPFDQDDFIGKVDLITCNPPYISSAQVDRLPSEISAHEPREAFDGGPFGIAILLRLIGEAPRFLRPNSWLCFEIGLGQDKAMLSRLGKTGVYPEVHTARDEQGNVRTLLARLG